MPTRTAGSDPAAGAVAGEESTRDDEALDLVRPLADDHQRGVAEVALDGELGRVADPAVDAHGLGRELERGLAREQLRHPGFDVAPFAGLLALGRTAREESSG